MVVVVIVVVVCSSGSSGSSGSSSSSFKYLNMPNSSRCDPAPANEDTVTSPGGTPYSRFTVPYGIPVGVLKAGSNRLIQ